MKGKMTKIFFLSSRRKHTRSLRDWSSDVCSSDLGSLKPKSPAAKAYEVSSSVVSVLSVPAGASFTEVTVIVKVCAALVRSEERRVGKESRKERALRTSKDKQIEWKCGIT